MEPKNETVFGCFLKCNHFWLPKHKYFRMIHRKVPNKNKHSSKRFHYCRKNGKWKPKKGFCSQEDADSFIEKHKMTDYISYLCPHCNMWHIGKKIKDLPL